MKVFNPNDLDIEKLLGEAPPDFKYDIDEFSYIFGALAKLKGMYKDNEDKEYTSLNAQLMQERIRTYNRHLQYLVDKGVLQTDGQYITGQKSKGYKFAAKYLKGGFKVVEIKKKSIARFRPREKMDIEQLNTEYGYLTKWFNDRLAINADRATMLLLRFALREQEAGSPDAFERLEYRRMPVLALQNGMYNLNVDKNIKRFHSNLTNIKKELRHFITYDGKRMCAIDISNSQPFFSMLLFNRDFYAKNKDGFTLYALSEELYSREETNQATLLALLPPKPFFMLVKSHEREAENDLELYCTLVDKGRLYQYISTKYFEKTGVALDPNVPEQKDKLKTAVFYTMYSSNTGFSEEHGPMKRLFRTLFPTVYKVFSLLKKSAHNDLALILQLIESEIVVRRAARAIAEAHPEIPIFTIHDNIATTIEHREYVYRTLKDECERAIGLMPTLKVEEWR